MSFVRKSVSEIQKIKNHQCWFVEKKIRIKELEGPVILKAQWINGFHERTGREPQLNCAVLSLFVVLLRMLIIYQNWFSDFFRTMVMKVKTHCENHSGFGAISDTRTTLLTTHDFKTLIQFISLLHRIAKAFQHLTHLPLVQLSQLPRLICKPYRNEIVCYHNKVLQFDPLSQACHQYIKHDLQQNVVDLYSRLLWAPTEVRIENLFFSRNFFVTFRKIWETFESIKKE